MREKWGARRGWIKVQSHGIDVETNQALGLEITDEAMQDDQRFIPLLDQTQTELWRGNTRCTEFSRDGAYDRKINSSTALRTPGNPTLSH